jgi:hypothetical protein
LTGTGAISVVHIRCRVVGLQIGDVRRLDADTWLYALGTTKTDTGGVRR